MTKLSTDQMFLQATRNPGTRHEFYSMIRPNIICVDGFRMSVQASESHYCTPRKTAAIYTHVEVGYPSMAEELLLPYAEIPEDPTGTVYGWVPVEVVDSIIEKHGGIARFAWSKDE